MNYKIKFSELQKDSNELQQFCTSKIQKEKKKSLCCLWDAVHSQPHERARTMWDAILHAVIRRTVRRRTPNCTRAAGDEHILDLGEGSLQGEEAVRQGDGRAPGGMGGGEHRLVSPTMSLEEAGKGRRHPDPYADNRRRALGMEKSSGPASFEQRRPWLYPFCGTKKDRGKG